MKQIARLAGLICLLAALASAASQDDAIRREQRLAASSSSGWILDSAQQVAADKSGSADTDDDTDEQPIVLNSVHSGSLQQQQQHSYYSALPSLGSKRPPTFSSAQRPSGAAFVAKREPLPIASRQPQHHNSSSSAYAHWPTSGELQEGRSGVSQPQHFAHKQVHQFGQQQQQQQQQPSQEFDSQLIGPRAGSVRLPGASISTRWPPAGFKPLESAFNTSGASVPSAAGKPFRDYHGISAAPYAVASQHQQTGSGGPVNQQQASSMVAQQFALANSAQASNYNQQEEAAQPQSIIRDTSELQQHANLLSVEPATSQWLAGQDREPPAELGGAATMWAQSVRDNHHGQLRSRFNLTSLSLSSGLFGGGGVMSDMVASMMVPVGGNAHLFDGHMKAKAGPVLVPYEQQVQAKSVRTTSPVQANSTDRESATTSSADSGYSSRRNSKFTRQTTTETTTPLSPAKPASEQHQQADLGSMVTSNRHAPSPAAVHIKRLSATPTTTTSASPNATGGGPHQATTEEPATGSGHVIPINETDLNRLAQKLQLERANNSSSQFNEIADHVELDKRTGEQHDIIQVMGNHHNGNLHKINRSPDEPNNSIRNNSKRQQDNSEEQQQQQQHLAGSIAGEILLSNNHSTRGQVAAAQNATSFRSAQAAHKPPSGKTGRKMMYLNEDAVSGQVAPRSGNQLQMNGINSAGGPSQQPARTWTRLLPGLLQRTISSVLRRLAGANPASPSAQHQQQAGGGNLFSGAPLVKFAPDATAAARPTPLTSLGLLTSALSAAATANRLPNRNPLATFEQPLESGPAQVSASGNSAEVKPSGLMQQAAAASVQDTVRQPLRQHANKKIIDSFVDLPVSERRQTIDKRQGDDGSMEADSTTTNSVPDDASYLDLSAINSGNKQRQQRGRSSKTTADWKQYEASTSEQSEMSSSPAPATQPPAAQADDYEADEDQVHEVANSGDREDSELGESAAQVAASKLAAGVDGKPIGSRLTRNRQEDNQDDDYQEEAVPTNRQQVADDEDDALESADSFVVENTKLYNMASEQIGKRKRPLAKPDEPEEEGAEEEVQESEEGEETAEPPPRPSYRELDGGGSVSLSSGQKRRRPPVAPQPIESGDESAADSEQAEARLVTRPSRRQKPVGPPHKRGRPAAGSVPKRRQPNATPPPISVQAAKHAGRQPARPASSPAIRPLSVFAPPPQTGESQEGGAGGQMMSPMSSSINVVDLDPSMTRLAHNKLIVAKFKPRNKLKLALAHQRTSKPLLAESRESGATNLVMSPVASSTTHKPVKKAADPSVASLTSAILGTQVMTNNHINDIIKRWSRPAQPAASRSEPQTSGSGSGADVHRSAELSPAGANSSGWLANSEQPANLRIVNDLHSFVPLTGLAARFSFPSGGRAALSTSTTTTRPRSANDHHVSSAGYQRQQQVAPTSDTSEPPPASSGPFKSDKFNFSLIQMNNRERVNPLLFPVERHSSSGATNQTHLKKSPGGARTRLTSSTTTFRPQTRAANSTPAALQSSAGSIIITTPASNSTPEQSSQPTSEQSTTSTTTTESPTTSGSSTTRHQSPNRASSSARWPSTSRRPQANRQPVADSNEPLALGQIMRNQHHTSRPANRLPLSESERLRNQYHSLIGHNSSLDARDDIANATLSGHMSLASVEEAAHDANKYLTLAANPLAPSSALSSSSNVNDDEHSIVIMSDNHHQARRRPGGTSRRPPPIASHSSPAEPMSTPAPALVNVGAAAPTLSSAQIARKYLEEFVNGSRIRPSSAASKTTTNWPKRQTTSNSYEQPLAQQNHPDHSNANGTKLFGQSASGSTESPIVRRFQHTDRLQAASGANNLTAFNSVNGAPLPDSSGLLGVEKLDEKAQELLLDVFDRDPSYSMNGIFSNQQEETITTTTTITPTTTTSKRRGGDTDDEGNLRKVYISNNQHNKAPDNMAPTATTTSSTTTSATDSEQVDGERFSITESPLSSTTIVMLTSSDETDKTADWKSSQAPAELQSGAAHEAASAEDTGDSRPTEPNVVTMVSTPEASTLSPYDEQNKHLEAGQSFGAPDEANNRASMRRNQAKIQAILMAIAKKNRNASQMSTTTEEPADVDSADQETSASVQASEQYTPASTFNPLPTSSPGALAGDNDELSASSSSGSDAANSEEPHETTRFYAPMKLTTLPAFQESGKSGEQQRRYPNVETLSSSRQKINRPASHTGSLTQSAGSRADSSSSSIDYTQMSASTPAMPSVSTTVTTKLTESPTNDLSLKQAIKNRVGGELVTLNKLATRPPASSELPAGDSPAPASATDSPDDQQLDIRGDTNKRGTWSRPENPDSAESADQDRYLDGDDEATRFRPVIIRRRPRPSSTRRPPASDASNSHRITLTTSTGDYHRRPGQPVKKRRRKPAKRPQQSQTAEPDADRQVSGSGSGMYEPPATSLAPVAQDNEEPEELPATSLSIKLTDGKHRNRPHSILLRPQAAGSKKQRPGYVRLPPDSIRIQDSHYGLHQNKTIIRRPGGHNGGNSSSSQPVSIILPMESLIKRKHQDIRTRPLIIIDPVTEQPLDPSNDSVVNPGTWTRIPETTIMHNKMVVTYKPGRPLPGALSGFGSIGQVGPADYTRPYLETGSSVSTASSGGSGSGSTTSSSLGASDETSGAANNSSSGEGATLALTGFTRPQLGSGNGGDTHLVSIEQQQQAAALHSTRRPQLTGNMGAQEGGPSEAPASTATSPSTTSTPAYQPAAVNNRPIIVINGLFDPPHHTANPHKPARPNGSTLVEAGSMSVVAAASSGQGAHNSSRPWYPTSATGNADRHTNSTSPNGTSTLSDAFGTSNDFSQSGSSSSSSFANQTADAVVGPEFPNFGAGSGAPSGSYQNHHHQQQQQLIGMPYLGPGGTLTGANRPSTGRPYRWRVTRRKPAGNNTSNDYSSASTVSSYVYRPVNNLFSFHTLVNIYDNVMIFFARIRTFLISMMVMFLPPLALAASVVNVMSS